MGLIFMAVGGYIILGALGIISFGKLQVPTWVVVGAGLVFFLAGAVFFFQSFMAPSLAPATVKTAKYQQTILPEERPAKLVLNWVVTLGSMIIVGIFWFVLLFGAMGEGVPWVFYVVLGIFTPVVLGALYMSVKLTLSALRFGYIPLYLLPASAISGRVLAGRLLIPVQREVLGTVSTRLICYKLRWRLVRTAKGRSRTSKSQEEHWSTAVQQVPVKPDGGVDIRFSIPPGPPGTTASLQLLQPDNYKIELDKDYYAWMLEVIADVPGVDLYRTYEVPVAEISPRLQDPDSLKSGVNTDLEKVEQKINAVRTVALAEFNSGKSVDGVTNKLSGMGIAPPIINAGLKLIANDPASPHRETIQIWLAQQNRMQAEMDAGQLMMLNRTAVPRPTGTSQQADIAFRKYEGASGKTEGTSQGTTQANSGLIRALGVILPLLFFGAYIYFDHVKFEKKREETRQKYAEQQAEVQARTQALKQRFRDYQFTPDIHTHYIYIAGGGITAEQQGNDLHLKLDKIQLEKHESVDQVSYSGLMIIVYQTVENTRTKLGSFWKREVTGELSNVSPVVTLKDQVFVLNKIGAACNTGSCEARLLINAQTSLGTGNGEYSGYAGFTAKSSGTVTLLAPASPEYWKIYYDKAVAASQQVKLAEAEQLFQETLEFIEQKLAPDHPAAARTLVSRADLYKQLQQPGKYEQDMLQAYAILDQYPDEEVKKELGKSLPLDKEQVARWLGDYYWDARRYKDSFKYYQLAYAAAPTLITSDHNRNLILALSSAGVMKTACTQRQWDLADRAMAELKERYPSVDPETQKFLDYWIRTGEPRLKKRKC